MRGFRDDARWSLQVTGLMSTLPDRQWGRGGSGVVGIEVGGLVGVVIGGVVGAGMGATGGLITGGLISGGFIGGV